MFQLPSRVDANAILPSKGMTALVAADAVLVPTAFVATTVNVYDVPLVSPVTVAVNVEPFTVAVSPPGDDVTV